MAFLNKKYELVLFDFDGTIMDTSEGIYDSANYCLKKYNIKLSKDINMKDFIGPPISYGFNQVFGVSNSEMVQTLMREYREHYYKIGAFKAKFYDGFPDIFKTLCNDCFLIAIASMKDTELINLMLKHFNLECYISGVFGLNALGTNTKADVIRDAMSEFHFSPIECVLVGDSKYDYEGALEAGVDCIKVNWGFGYGPDDLDTVSNTDQLYQRLFY